MVKRSHKGQLNKRNKAVFKALNDLMEDLGEKYSIRVGIIGEQAYEKHPHTDLTFAQLGAIHEFGATINVTDKMRAYLHYNGMHLTKDTSDVIIPTRSFLRMPLLSEEFKEQIMNELALSDAVEFKDIDYGKIPLHTAKYINKYKRILRERAAREFNRDIAEAASYRKGIDLKGLMLAIANTVGAKGLERVQEAFNSSGFGKWAPITSYTAEHRSGDASNPPLQDTGDLMESVTFQVKKVS